MSDSLTELVRDAGVLVAFALRFKIALPPGTAETLALGVTDQPRLQANAPDLSAFVQAYETAAASVQAKVGDLRVSQQRCHRIAPQLAAAQRLLQFADASGKTVDDTVRDGILNAAQAVDAGVPSQSDEQQFLKAYNALALATRPVTAETLETSGVRMPGLERLLDRWPVFDVLRELKPGRTLHWIAFAIVLLATGISLHYFAVGSSMLARYEQLGVAQKKLSSDAVAARDALTVLELSQGSKPQATDDTKRKLEAVKAQKEAEAELKTVEVERTALAERLWHWAMQPCGPSANVLFSSTHCSGLDEAAFRGTAAVSQQQQLEAARLVASRSSTLYLPLLMGLLGAYAFLLRKLTREIAENLLSSGSAIQHLVRLALGAMAGFASSFLLTPEIVGGAQLKGLSAWALAFIAGYGIELVFAFMDRIINAFTTKPA